ncbi:MAG: AAA-like domain-containing protein, partial [Bacteroidales bacterium]|nr:AAA-like domain-containing protein [Bacteroidales bacterium]
MSKILKPYTIIPPDLYIEREADRQIENIIRDMGRPGYVLVSRQMGKTNLLLNAKRRLESADDIYAYIDLSNPFEDLRSCFENIVDTILDTNEEKLSTINETIKNNRKQQIDIPPHKQHLNELRLIVKNIQGKLVIILDEIDALTKKTYSDQIFAQIRSIYFSRANYKEDNRLTYILSGVIEPNEIIKDPKISPFNIGEKIFLNDFSKNEFENFIAKSQLDLSEEVRQRIFYWTDGNPRMTWDVCSEIEDRYRNTEITQINVDDLIREMYLTTFDRSPVDNIREIVKYDRELRNAIIEIAYKKGKEVSDKIKSKLYLSGITNYNDNNDIHIKNEILKKSLSLDWIKKVEEEDKGLIKLALEFHEKENYSESLAYFEKFLENNIFDSEVESLYYYYMGSAAYHLSNFKKSLEFLNRTNFNKEESEKFYYISLNLKGLVNFYVGKIEESLTYLQQVIDTKKGDEIYVRALLNYGSIAIKSNINRYANDATTIFENVTNEEGFNKDKLEENFVNEVKAIAYYNLAQINSKNKKIDFAIN